MYNIPIVVQSGKQAEDCHISPAGHGLSIGTTDTPSIDSEKLTGNAQRPEIFNPASGLVVPLHEESVGESNKGGSEHTCMFSSQPGMWLPSGLEEAPTDMWKPQLPSGKGLL